MSSKMIAKNQTKNSSLFPQPAFSPSTKAYTVAEQKRVASVAITAEPAVPSCLIAVNNLAVASGMPTPPIPLSGKSTTVTVTVTSADTLANSTYTLSISSAGGNDQTDVSLLRLSCHPATAWL